MQSVSWMPNASKRKKQESERERERDRMLGLVRKVINKAK
jgi:hypothetical protein